MIRLYNVLILLGLLTNPLSANAAHVMYVVTGTDNNMLVINTQKDEIVDVVGQLENAHGLAGNANTDFLVAGSMNQAGDKKETVKPESVSEEAHEAHHSSSNNLPLLKTHQLAGKSYVSIVNLKDGQVVRRIEVSGVTHHTSVAPDGKTAIAVHSKNNGISVIDLDTFKVKTFIKTGQVPNYAIFNSKGEYLFISNAGSGVVSMINTKNWQIEKQIKVGMGPEHLFIDAYDEVLYVVNVIGGTVSVVNLADTENVHTIKVGKSPHGISLSSDGYRLFVSNKGSNTLSRINLDNDKVTTIALSPAPYHLEVIPNTNKLYVSSRKQPKIWVVDQNSLKISKVINLKSGIAHQMVVFDR